MKPLILAVFLAASLSGCIATPAAVLAVGATVIGTVQQACSELSAETKANARQLTDGKPIICEDE